MALIVLGLFTVIGIFYSVLVATMVGQRIWQRHYHILAKRMLTKVCLVYFLIYCCTFGTSRLCVSSCCNSADKSSFIPNGFMQLVHFYFVYYLNPISISSETFIAEGKAKNLNHKLSPFLTDLFDSCISIMLIERVFLMVFAKVNLFQLLPYLYTTCIVFYGAVLLYFKWIDSIGITVQSHILSLLANGIVSIQIWPTLSCLLPPTQTLSTVFCLSSSP